MYRHAHRRRESSNKLACCWSHLKRCSLKVVPINEMKDKVQWDSYIKVLSTCSSVAGWGGLWPVLPPPPVVVSLIPVIVCDFDYSSAILALGGQIMWTYICAPSNAPPTHLCVSVSQPTAEIHAPPAICWPLVWLDGLSPRE